MAIISPKNHLSDIILSYPESIPLINRLGINLGVGDKTIEAICHEKNIDTEFFASIINTFINENFFPEKVLKSFKAETIVSYISKTYNYYTHYMIPNIERHFNLLIAHSGNNNNLGLMLQFFNELKNDLLKSINHDTTQWFPLILSLENDKNTPLPNGLNITDNSLIEDKLNDLKSMFVIHLSGNYELNLCYAVITSIIALEKDLKQNNRIRNRILALIYNNLAQL